MHRFVYALLLEATICLAMASAAQAGTITSVTAGAGLTGGGTNGDVTVAASFGGDGSSSQVCHSDHTHAGQSWTMQDRDGLEVSVTCTSADPLCIKDGVFGANTAPAGHGNGVYGRVLSPNATGVYGSNIAASGQAVGITGSALSPDGIGVYGTSGNSSSGRPIGMYGLVSAPGGIGTSGVSGAATGAGSGIFGQSSSPSGFGVYGEDIAATGGGIGVEGQSYSAGGYAGLLRNRAGGTALRVRVDNPTRTTKFISATNGAYLSSGGTWTNASDVHLKDNFTVLDESTVLRQLRAMPIQEWSYTTEGASVRHVGPTAQDFHAAFALGSDDTSITTVDEAGIALAAIQELDRRTAEIAQLKEQVARLEAAVQALQAAAKP